MNVVVVFYGRFQPPHVGHIAVYTHLVKKFGKENVYIGTSTKTDPETSPLTFEWKRKLWQSHGVPQEKILKTRMNYNSKEVQDLLGVDPNSTAFVVAVGEKDATRLRSPYFSAGGKIKSATDLKPMSQVGYIYVIPNIKFPGGNVASATEIRSLLRGDSLSANDLSYLSKIMSLDKREVLKIKPLFEHSVSQIMALVEGGAAGHMSHLFEDYTMSFEDINKIISAAFEGNLQKTLEGPVTEKVDGQNLFASFIDGKIRFARNKSHLKNSGKGSMSPADIAAKWNDFPAIKSAFLSAAKTLEDGFSKIPSAKLDLIFANGKRWVNFEILWTDSKNVINYDDNAIIFHNVQSVDENGSTSGIDKSYTALLLSIFKKAERSSKTGVKIQPPQIVKVDRPLNIDFSSEESQLKSELASIVAAAGLTMRSTVGDLLRVNWDRELKKVEASTSYKIPPSARDRLIDRFAFADKSYAITQWPKDIKSAVVIDALKALDSSSGKKHKEFIWPLERLILKFGTLLLQSVDTFISANPDKTIQSLRKDIASQISKIRSSKNSEDIAKMMDLLKKIDAAGGFSQMSPSEGIVFRYNDKIYKITGLFAPINQLMGIGRF